jgi:hypothetical protein
MQVCSCFLLVSAPMQDDAESRRWYSDGGASAIVLTDGGRLLEPLPTFGPEEYRLLATEATLAEANEFALEHGFTVTRERV